MIKTENIKEMIREMEEASTEIKAMREADRLHNILVYGYRAIMRETAKKGTLN